MSHLKDDFARVAEVNLVYRNKVKAPDRPQVATSRAAYALFLDTWDMDKIELQEQFRIMLLDRGNKCMGISTVATGGMSACLVDSKIIFSLALKARATAIILAHNHPSGQVKPSLEDKRLTDRLARIGELLELPVLDHLVVALHDYTSFADEGLFLTASPEMKMTGG